VSKLSGKTTTGKGKQEKQALRARTDADADAGLVGFPPEENKIYDDRGTIEGGWREPERVVAGTRSAAALVLFAFRRGKSWVMRSEERC